MIAYVPNTAKNRRLRSQHFTGHLPDSPDGKATEVRRTTFLDEDIEVYFWKGNTLEFNVNTFYYDVLRRFVKEVGFEGVSYSNCTRAYKFQKPPQPKKTRKNEIGFSILRLFRL